MSSTLMGAAAIGLALIAAGCGQAKMAAAPLLQAHAQTPAAVAPERAATTAASPAVVQDAPQVALATPRIANAGERIDGPRECAPDKGVTEACTYN